METTLKSYKPFAYHVNDVHDFDRGLVEAFKTKDTHTLNTKISLAKKSDYKVYICVNKSYHAFVLCKKDKNSVEGDISELLGEITRIELCFEYAELRSYKIRSKTETFVNVKGNIKKAYFIVVFKGVSEVAFQCAALGASPETYRVFLDDCVEFSKHFCKELLKYASNGYQITADVELEIKSATASGFTAEQLSRENQSSAYWMNSFLGGSDVTTFLMSGKGKLLLIIIVIVYPILVTWLMSGN